MSPTGGSSYMTDTPVFRPSKEEFSKPFCDYVNKVLKKHPNIPMFKVVPPEGWKPRKAPIRLSKLDIQCPIKQHAYGTKGCYRCILVEQKKLSAEEFRLIAQDQDHAPPSKVRDGEDKLLERSFWSSVTINPPLYGADTPLSLFDEKLPYGWNLKHLGGCLLKRPDVPQVPGVTTPMTYFGMWKSYFAWHVEDADLFSINYLHFGAPKVWYCVAPSNRAKFERMCQSIFPELHKCCHAFMRHKDILLSPGLLRTYGIEYMQAKQEPNEFIVLNAAAYHAGYNMGFNVAEAVNFAPPSWIDIGRNVVRCKCRDDGVRLSMRLFGCSSGSSATSSEYSDSEEDEDGSDRSSSDEEGESSQEVSSGGRDSDADEEADSGGRAPAQRSRRGQQQQQQQQQHRSGGARRAAAAGKEEKSAAAAAAAPAPERRSKRNAAAAAALSAPSSKRSRQQDVAVGPLPPRAAGPRNTRTARAAAEAAKKMRRTNATAEARAKLAVQRGRASKSSSGGQHRPRPSRAKKSTADLEDSLQRAAAAAAAIRARQQQAASQGHAEPAGGSSDDDEQQQQQPPGAVKQEQQQARSHSSGGRALAAGGAAAAAAAGIKAEPESPSPGEDEFGPEEPDSPTATKARLSSQGKLKHEVDAAAAAEDSGFAGRSSGGAERGRAAPGRAAAAAAADGPSGEAPRVILGEDSHGSKYFYMVQVLREHKPKRRGHLIMRWLKEGKDGLFRASTDTWEEPASCLLGVRTQWVPGKNGKPGGYRLLTLRSRILDTQLLD